MESREEPDDGRKIMEEVFFADEFSDTMGAEFNEFRSGETGENGGVA